MKAAVFRNLGQFLVLALLAGVVACGKPRSAAQVNPQTSAPQSNVSSPAYQDDATPQAVVPQVQHFPLETSTPDVVQTDSFVKPDELTIDHLSGDVSLSVEFSGVKEPVVMKGLLDPKEGMAHLLGTDDQSEAYAVCLDPQNCSSMVVTIYKNKDGKLEHSQFVTTEKAADVSSTPSPAPEEPATPATSASTRIKKRGPKDEDDSIEDEPDEEYEEYAAPPSTLVKPDAKDSDVPNPPSKTPPSVTTPKGTIKVPTHVSSAYGKFVGGELLDPVVIPDQGQGFVRNPSARAKWGTDALVNLLLETLGKLQQHYPDEDPLIIGNLSLEHGGPMTRMENGKKVKVSRSHQNGLDADVGYPLRKGYPSVWPKCTNFRGKFNPDCQLDRFWYYLKELAETGQVIDVFVDDGIKKAVCQYAQSIGEVPQSVNDVSFKAMALLSTHFRHPTTGESIHSDTGHKEHFHVRIQCPSTEVYHCQLAKVTTYTSVKDSGVCGM